MSPLRDDRWQHLVQLAFRLSESQGDSGRPGGRAAAPDASGERSGAAMPGSRREVERILDSALEVFDATIDPVEDFEGYALRRLLLALRQAIHER